MITAAFWAAPARIAVGEHEAVCGGGISFVLRPSPDSDLTAPVSPSVGKRGIVSGTGFATKYPLRPLKPFVIDQKNFLFANTPSGAKSSAVIFSLIQTAAENGLDPYRYLAWLLASAAQLDLSLPDHVQLFLPWNAPVSCYAK